MYTKTENSIVYPFVSFLLFSLFFVQLLNYPNDNMGKDIRREMCLFSGMCFWWLTLESTVMLILCVKNK